MSEKIIRDPVHDVIAFQLAQPIDGLLFGLINAAEFQRLRRIRQLGMASLAYPGADHSRYSHSLGVMETARKILNQLRQSIRIEEENETICLVAALLHDLGHGPFSHVFERVSGIDHEKLTERVISDPESEVHQILTGHDSSLPMKVIEFLRCRPKRTFYCDIISSQLDADRLDYLLRDNLMTGSGYGDYDLRWLLHALTVDEQTDRLAIHPKGISAVEAYLQSRFHMYRNVYFHKVVRSAEGMVKLALQRARRLAVQQRLDWPQRDEAVHKALLGQQLSMREFAGLDDVSVLHCFKLWTDSSDPVLAGLCRGLLFREVYKTIDLTRIQEEKAQTVVAAAQKAVAESGGEPAYDLFYDEPADTPYQISDDATGSSEIFVREADAKLVPFAALSPLPQALSQQLMFRRLHVAENWKDVVMKVVANP